MELFKIFGKWFWALCILTTFVNGAVFRFRAQKHIKLNPELGEGYNKIIKGFVIWCSIPWIVMGIGCTVGGVPSVWYYFNPKAGNLYVLAFFASVFLIWVLGSYWILFKGGALDLVKYSGILNYDIKNPTILKLIWIICVLGGIVAVLMMFTQNIPIPKM